MTPQLPPPDPHESLDLMPGEDVPIAEPTVVFAAGEPSADTDRLADAILDLRPGMLVVLIRG